MQYEENKTPLPFSPCGRRWREAPDEGSLSTERTPHPPSLRECTFSHKGRREERFALKTKRPRSKPGPDVADRQAKRLLVAVLESRAENIAQRRSRIARAVLRAGFHLFATSQRRDRGLHLGRRL